MTKTLLRVVTPEKTCFEQEVDRVTFDGLDGKIGVLPGHIPLIVALKEDATVLAENSQNTHVLNVAGGFAKIAANNITILTAAAEKNE